MNPRTAVVALAAAALAAGCSASSARPAPTVTVTVTVTRTVTAPAPGTTSPAALTLSFDCTLNETDSYTLAVTNSNAEPVTADITVGFYAADGTQMGTDEKFLTVGAATTYDYQGSYAQFELGGIPASCHEIEWQQQS